MSGERPHARRLALAGLALVAVAVATWLASRPAAGDGAAAPFARGDEVVAGAPELAAPRDDARRPDAVRGATGDGLAPDPARDVRPPAAEDELVVLVSGADGRPRAGARVTLYDATSPGLKFSALRGHGAMAFGPQPWREARTDATGTARFPAPDPKALDVLAWLPELPPAHATRAPTDRLVRVAVPDALRLRGTVLVDGAPPGEPLHLGVRCASDFLPTGGSAAGDVLRAAGIDTGTLDVAVAADGSFAVRGIDSARAVTLSAPPDFRGAGGGAPRLEVAGGADSVTFQLSRAPLLGVRVVERDATDAGTTRQLVARFRDAANRSLPEQITGVSAASPASLPLPAGAATVELEVRHADTGRVLARRIERDPQPGALIELDVPQVGRALVVDVRDEHGARVPGAVARTDDALWPASDDGRIRIDVLTPIAKLVVGAPGRAAVGVDVATPPPEQQTVTLSPATRVRLVVVATEADRDGLRVDVRVARSGAWPRERLEGGPSSELDAHGAWTAEDLPSGVPVVLVLRDRYRFEIERVELTLAPGEQRELACTVAAGGHDVALRVVDPAGNPVAGAEVHVARDTPRFFDDADATTDRDGRALLRGVRAVDAELDVTRSGWVPRRIALADALAGDVRLEPARSLLVRIERPPGDASNAGDAPLEIEFEAPVPIRAIRESAGLYRFDVVPNRAGIVRCLRPSLRVPVSAGAHELTLVIP